MPLQSEQDTEEKLLLGLNNNVYQLIVLYKQLEDKQYYCKKCGIESLMFALPKGHKYARRKSLSFAEMNGENMLLMPDIGFWDFVKEKMPDSRFLVQNDRFSFNELLLASSLPSFTTDLAKKYNGEPIKRICIPISDSESTATYYLVCKIENKKTFLPLFKAL